MSADSLAVRRSSHPPTLYPSAAHIRPPTAIISQVLPPRVRTIPRGGYIARQRPGLMPFSFARHGYGGTQALNYHHHQQMQAQLGAAGQMLSPPRTRGGPPGGGNTLPMYFDPHHPIVHPTFPPGIGGPHPLPPNLGVPLVPPPVGPTRAYTHQPSWQANLPSSSQPSLPYIEDPSGSSHNTALPPPPSQSSLPYTEDLSGSFHNTALPPLPPPPQPVSLGSPEPPLHTPPPSACNETSQKKTRIAATVCPFPQCPKKSKKYGREQDVKRHVHQHLPHYIYCSQLGCNWTGIRRYQLREHLKKKHGGARIPKEQRMFIIYDAKRLVKQLLKREITVELAENEACVSYQEKAVQLGKLGSWRSL